LDGVEGDLRLMPDQLQQERQAFGGIHVILDHQAAAGPLGLPLMGLFGHGRLLPYRAAKEQSYLNAGRETCGEALSEESLS
jgi:hypothetical protein